MQTIFTIQDNIYVLGLHSATVRSRLAAACLRVGLPCLVAALDCGQLVSMQQAAFLLVCTDSASLQECQSAPIQRRWWFLADTDTQTRQTVYGSGCSLVISPEASNAELDCHLRQVHEGRGAGLLVRGISNLSMILSGEVAGPLHYMSLGLRAMNRELGNLKPLFDDLHKAWFKSDKDLLEKLRLILSVINLQQSWAELERTLENYDTGLSRLRDIHNFLRLGIKIEEEAERQTSLDEMVHTCLVLLKESRSDGIHIQEAVPSGLFCRMKTGTLYFGFMNLVAILIEKLLDFESGRGQLHLTGAAGADGFLRLDILVKSENNPGDQPLPLPDLSLPIYIFEGLGIRIHVDRQQDAILLGLDIPRDQEGNA